MVTRATRGGQDIFVACVGGKRRTLPVRDQGAVSKRFTVPFEGRIFRLQARSRLHKILHILWAHERGVQPCLIEPGKPNHDACTESFSGRLRHECLNERWFQARCTHSAEIERWRREYHEERPKKALGRLAPPPMRNR